MWPRPCPRPVCPQYLPISTGNVGVSLGTGAVEMYGHNYSGTGIGLFYGCANWCPPCPPFWGAGPGCCGSGGGFSNALAAVLTSQNWCTATVPSCPYNPPSSPTPMPGAPCPQWPLWVMPVRH